MRRRRGDAHSDAEETICLFGRDGNLSIEEDGSDGEEAEGGQAKGEEGGDVQVLNDLVEQLDGQAEEGGRSSIPVRSDGRLYFSCSR